VQAGIANGRRRKYRNRLGRVRLKRACGVQELHNWFLRQNRIGNPSRYGAQGIMDVFQIPKIIPRGVPNWKYAKLSRICGILTEFEDAASRVSEPRGVIFQISVLLQIGLGYPLNRWQ
jgi:hypothetical protein